MKEYESDQKDTNQWGIKGYSGLKFKPQKAEFQDFKTNPFIFSFSQRRKH